MNSFVLKERKIMVGLLLKMKVIFRHPWFIKESIEPLRRPKGSLKWKKVLQIKMFTERFFVEPENVLYMGSL